jgi:hypothetical protein
LKLETGNSGLLIFAGVLVQSKKIAWPFSLVPPCMQKHGWTELARYARSIDSFHRLIAIRPTDNGCDQVEDPEVID